MDSIAKGPDYLVTQGGGPNIYEGTPTSTPIPKNETNPELNCDHCQYPLREEHAHYRCDNCGNRTSCCEGV